MTESIHGMHAPDFDPRACLRLPDSEDQPTEHAVVRRLHGDRPEPQQ
jgi:hypothetical protein